MYRSGQIPNTKGGEGEMSRVLTFQDFCDIIEKKEKKAGSKVANLQPGTEEFNAALHKHLYGKKKTKDPQPGTEEFNAALYKHLYGKEKPKATDKKED